MTQTPTSTDWATLGIDPTHDAGGVRRAYRGRLREVGPESDPAGFQALRAAYERILAAVDAVTPAPAAVDSEHAAATAATFVAALHTRRAAGDEIGAIALVDEAITTHPPGSAAAEAIDDVLLEQVAFSRNVSPGLFRHLVDRFDWRDVQGHAARRDPERHAFLLDRIAAEDWYHSLAGQADGLGMILLGDRTQASAALRTSPITPERRQHVRDLFEQLLEHATFVLVRFDGGTLAVLREAVEGPPLLGEAVKPIMEPAARPDASITDLVSPQRRRLIRFGVFGVVGAALGGKLLFGSSSAPRGSDTALAAEVALPILKDPKVAWVDLVPGPDGVKVDWAPVMRMRRAIKELHTGYNGEGPTTLFNLPDTDAAIGFIAPPSIERISMRILYIDGTWSEVRSYDIQKAKQ